MAGAYKIRCPKCGIFRLVGKEIRNENCPCLKCQRKPREESKKSYKKLIVDKINFLSLNHNIGQARVCSYLLTKYQGKKVRIKVYVKED